MAKKTLLLIFISLIVYYDILSFPRTEIYRYWGEMFLLFVAYFLLLENDFLKKQSTYFYIALALLFRVAMLFHIPNLSDDFYRFIWDGRLGANGENPFFFLPDEIVHLPHYQAYYLNETLYTHLNSPHFYTIYPPVCQSFFTLSALCFPQNIMGASIMLKLAILLAEIISCFLIFAILKKWQIPKEIGLLYALNPMIIVELTGNIHFEAWMIMGVLGAIYFLENKILSAFFLSLAICAKLIPLLFIPLLFRQIGGKQTLLYGIIVGGFCGLFFLPFWDIRTIEAIISSSRLYFQHFEFNASLFYLAKALHLTFLLRMLFFLVFFTIAVFPSFWGIKNLPPEKAWIQQIFWVLCCYILISASVHPWYIMPIFAFSVLTPWRFPLLWLCLLPLTYFAYHQIPYTENAVFLWLEYGFVGMYGLWEMGKKSHFHFDS